MSGFRRMNDSTISCGNLIVNSSLSGAAPPRYWIVSSNHRLYRPSAYTRRAKAAPINTAAAAREHGDAAALTGSRSAASMSYAAGSRARPRVIASREPFFQEHVQHDKHVSAAHFLDAELGHARRASAPANRNHGVRVATHDRLEWKLHGEVEMARHDRPGSVDRLAPKA